MNNITPDFTATLTYNAMGQERQRGLKGPEINWINKITTRLEGILPQTKPEIDLYKPTEGLFSVSFSFFDEQKGPGEGRLMDHPEMARFKEETEKRIYDALEIPDHLKWEADKEEGIRVSVNINELGGITKVQIINTFVDKTLETHLNGLPNIDCPTDELRADA